MGLFSDDEDASFRDENVPPVTTTRPGARKATKAKIMDLSDSEPSFMEPNNDDDSDFEMSPKPKPAAKKAAPAKKKAAAPKKTTNKAKEPLKSLDNDMSITGQDDGSGSSGSTPEPLAPPSATGNGKSASSQYQRLSPVQHVLKRPDTYVGSIEPTETKMWVLDPDTQHMTLKDVTIVPGLYKIFDEILVNAADNKIRDPNMDTLTVNIDVDKNVISVYNNGRGIPVEMHEKEKMYIPELIFGNLLTSSNYDDQQKKVTGGRNGYGAKLCNIFSTKFVVETADKTNGKKYVQTWTDNMGKVTKPKITDLKKDEEYTKITFMPDLEKFKMEKLDNDILGVMMRRVYDVAGTLSGIKVTLNGQRLKIKSFKQYVELFVRALQEQSSGSTPDTENGTPQPKPTIVHERVNDRWEIAFAVSDGNSFNQVSFVNSIATTSGGTHVNYIADQLVTKIMEVLKKKNKSAPIRPVQIRNNMFVFINCLIENPAFTSQTKEQLTTKSSSFGSKATLSEEFLKKVQRTSIVESVQAIAMRNADKELGRSDGGKKKRITGYAKLEDANKAGTREGHKCTLILTEGDSAKALAVAGLAVVGRDYYGVFPLRGKLLNVREASHDQIMKNAEIQAIKQIMGLQHKKHYTSIDNLRYGKIMIMTDQDHDGSHIKGLIINFLESSFPGLLDIPDFLVEFITPIVKVSIMRGKKVERVIPFYTMPQYEHWRDTEGKTCVWKQKYYKGLGTSEPNTEGREYFSQLDKHIKTFRNLETGDKGLIELAFGKKNADARKDWLRAFKPGTHLDPDLSLIPISDFINKELILFSMADNIRSIPSVLDGLKPGQRKVLYGCFKRNLITNVKVSELGGYISEKTGYHHGDQSMYQTIVGLAQDFVGSNNIYYLMPRGSFGTRAVGGKDAAAPRYIYTELNPITRKLFNKNDDPLYRYLDDDESTVEPEWYLPVIPTILVNGAEGIGTGWSTNIPPFNPTDIVANIKKMMAGEEPEPMYPWFRGWTGTIEPVGGGTEKFIVSGTLEEEDDKTVVITELPARMWTQTMKEYLLEAIVKDKKDTSGWIDDMIEEHGAGIRFVVTMTRSQMEAARQEGFMKRFKLQAPLSLGNMVAFDPNGRIKKYDNVQQILSDFYYVRLEYYQRRKDYMCNALRNQLEKLSQQARFIKMIIDKKLVVSNRKRADLVDQLAELNFPKFGKDGIPVYATSEEEKTATELEILAEQDPELAEVKEDDAVNKPEAANYDYLLGMAIWSLTRERYEKLLKERDNKEEELTELLRKSAKDLWSSDLDDFLASWQAFMEEDEDKRNSLISGKPTRAKKRAPKRKKKDEDDDDDFVPGAKRKTAKAAGDKDIKKEPATKAEVKQEPVFGNGAVRNVFGSPPNTKKTKDIFGGGKPDDLFNDLISPAAKAKAATNNKTEKKKSIFADLDLSGDEEIFSLSGTSSSTPLPEEKKPAAKPAKTTKAPATTKAKAPAKKAAPKKKIEPIDDDEDVEMEEVKAARAPRRTTTKKANYAIESFDDDDSDDGAYDESEEEEPSAYISEDDD